MQISLTFYMSLTLSCSLTFFGICKNFRDFCQMFENSNSKKLQVPAATTISSNQQYQPAAATSNKHQKILRKKHIDFLEKALKGRLSPPLVASRNAKAWKGKSKRFKKGIDKKKHPHPLGRAATISCHFTINWFSS